MDLRKILHEIRINKNADIHFHQILALLKANPARHLQVRALLAKSKSEWQREKAASLAKMAGDILLTKLGRPKFAEVVYRYSLAIAEDQLPSLMALFDIAESQNQYLVAYELAEKIFRISSLSEARNIRFRLQKMALRDPHSEPNNYFS